MVSVGHRDGWKLQHLSRLGWIYHVLSTALFAKHVVSGWGWNLHKVTCFGPPGSDILKQKEHLPHVLLAAVIGSLCSASQTPHLDRLSCLLKPFREFETLTQWSGGKVGPRTLKWA